METRPQVLSDLTKLHCRYGLKTRANKGYDDKQLDIARWRPYPQNACTFWSDVEPMGRQKCQVSICIQLDNVLQGCVSEGLASLRPVQPLEGDVLKSGGQAVSMINWGQTHCPISIA